MLPKIKYTLNGATYLADELTQGLSGVKLITELEDGQLFYRTKWNGEITHKGRSNLTPSARYFLTCARD